MKLEIKSLLKDCKEVENFYEEYSQKIKEGNITPFERMYRHEILKDLVAPIQFLEGWKDLKENKKLEQVIPVVKRSLKNIKRHKGLREITEMTPENITTLSYDSYPIILEELANEIKEIQTGCLTLNISGKSPCYSNLKPAVLRAIVSNIYGNALKWVPKRGNINTEISNPVEKKFRIKMENDLNPQPRNMAFGSNEGFGLKFTEDVIKTLKGRMIKYYSPEINPEGGFYLGGCIKERKENQNIYGIELEIPISGGKDLTSKL